jgi:hypothetical protein
MCRHFVLMRITVKILLGVVASGCAKPSNQNQGTNSPIHAEVESAHVRDQPKASTNVSLASNSVTMRGLVVHKPWTKSGESWEAGGSDYYVLETLEKRSIILRPSEKVTFEDLAPFAGKQVEVVGRVVEPEPWKPSGFEQYPVGLNDEPTATRGGGFRVEQIKVALE